jgi:hypothetical protein
MRLDQGARLISSMLSRERSIVLDTTDGKPIALIKGDTVDL